MSPLQLQFPAPTTVSIWAYAAAPVSAAAALPAWKRQPGDSEPIAISLQWIGSGLALACLSQAMKLTFGAQRLAKHSVQPNLSFALLDTACVLGPILGNRSHHESLEPILGGLAYITREPDAKAWEFWGCVLYFAAKLDSPSNIWGDVIYVDETSEKCSTMMISVTSIG